MLPVVHQVLRGLVPVQRLAEEAPSEEAQTGGRQSVAASAGTCNLHKITPPLGADLSRLVGLLLWGGTDSVWWGRLGLSIIFISCVASFPAEKLFFILF